MNKKETKQFCSGWDFAASIAGNDVAASNGKGYIDRIIRQISAMEEAINGHRYRNAPQFHGYVAEEFGAGTFNINAAAANSRCRAVVLGSNDFGSVDVRVYDRHNIVDDYSFKAYITAEKSAKAQAEYSTVMGLPKYHGQRRWVPMDQFQSAIAHAHRESLRNIEIRPSVSAAYAETEKELTDVVRHKNVRSVPVTRDQLVEMARKGRAEEFCSKEFGICWQDTVTTEYLLKECALAGCSAATLSTIYSLAPDVFSLAVRLIRKEKILPAEIKNLGIKGVSSYVKSFIQGAVACWIKLLCEKGTFGTAFIGADPTVIGSLVSISMRTVVNTVLLVSGKLSPDAFKAAIIDSVVITGGYIAGAKIGKAIDSAIGWKIPVGQLVLGPAVGWAASATYKTIKNRIRPKEIIGEGNYESVVSVEELSC